MISQDLQKAIISYFACGEHVVRAQCPSLSIFFSKILSKIPPKIKTHQLTCGATFLQLPYNTLVYTLDFFIIHVQLVTFRSTLRTRSHAMSHCLVNFCSWQKIYIFAVYSFWRRHRMPDLAAVRHRVRNVTSKTTCSTVISTGRNYRTAKYSHLSSLKLLVYFISSSPFHNLFNFTCFCCSSCPVCWHQYCHHCHQLSLWLLGYQFSPTSNHQPSEGKLPQTGYSDESPLTWSLANSLWYL